MGANRLRRIALPATACGVLLLLASQANAVPPPFSTIDTLHIVCTLTTVCSSSGGIQVTGSGSPTFDITNVNGTNLSGTGGELFLGVLVPNVANTFSFKANGTTAETPAAWTGPASSTVWTQLGEIGGNNYGFGALSGKSSLIIDVTGLTYQVYDVTLGTTLPPVSVSFSDITGGSFPLGTILFAFLEDTEKNCTSDTDCTTGTTHPVVNETSLGQDLLIVPEPGTLLLLGSGLSALGFLGRKKRWFDRATN